MKKPLVIFTHGGGRLANQLINFGHLIGWLEENQGQINLINMVFWNYAGLFRGTESNRLCRYPDAANSEYTWLLAQSVANMLQHNKYGNGVKSIRRILKYICRLPAIELNNTTLNIDTSDFNEFILSHRFTLLGGWGFRNWTLFKKHQQYIREFLYPAQRYQTIASSFIQSIRPKHDILVGVLIRQDDYRIWCEGKYFFETIRYVDWMKEIIDLFYPQHVGFVIASDEEQYEVRFQGIDYYMATGIKTGDGHYLENLLELSLCDVIMSPPSTFSAWATFVGDKPLFPLVDYTQHLTRETILPNNIFDAYKHPEFSVAVR